MKIGVVSDTHLSQKSGMLPKALTEGLQGVDFIFHAGDWVSSRVADELAAIAPLDGVAGNNDGPELVERFGRRKLVQIQQVTFGLFHGDGYGKTTEQRALEAFKGEQVDVILFGHSHVPFIERKEGILLFNPGSPTDKRRQPRFSYGIIEISDDREVEARHYFFDAWRRAPSKN